MLSIIYIWAFLHFEHIICILSMVLQHEVYSLSMTFRHKVSIFWAWCFCILHIHSKFSISVTQSCSLWKSTFVNEDNDKAMTDNTCRLKNLIPFTKTSTGDTYVTTSCCLTICVSYTLPMSRSNVLTTHTQAPSCSIPTQVIKTLSWQNYVCMQVTIMWHARAASNTLSMIASKEREVIHGISWPSHLQFFWLAT